ncbi:MAG TPA: GNAT family N-acetyltransferase [Xanthobacteraceae bacterium]|jgi:GNAT superfamily N-acetyltransferase|nr:GNAT family N-acetyltransferase [Xanthobacteraceae bacterium]
MAATVDRYRLRPVRSPREWNAYHAIRRDAIFAALLPGQDYDERDPDEFAPGHFPHVLVYDSEIVGTVRIDLIDERVAGLRLIGVRGDLQRQGHGRVLLRLAEQTVRAFDRTEIVINAHPSSLAFYLANGYREGEWDAGAPRPGLIRVGKRLP